MIVTPGVIWTVAVGQTSAEPLYLRLQNKHYDPIDQAPTPSMVSAVQQANPAQTDHLNLAGGATRIHQLTTWNVSAFQTHSEEIFQLQNQVTALQETGTTERAQVRHSRQARQSGLEVIWGAPTSLVKSSSAAWRPNKGAIPGVAIQYPAHLDAVAFPPLTGAGKRLWTSGRLVMATLLLGNIRSLVASIYYYDLYAKRPHPRCSDLSEPMPSGPP